MLFMGQFFTTAQAAAKIGVSRQTLYSWIASGLVTAPKAIPVGDASIRLWTQDDINLAAKAKGKLRRGPKPKRQRKVRR
jgi:predicted DNA-binding transcriptional regulator AlpA